MSQSNVSGGSFLKIFRSPVQFRSNNVKHEEESVAGVTSQLPNTGDLIAMLARQAQENVIAQGLLSLNTEGLQAQQQPYALQIALSHLSAH